MKGIDWSSTTAPWWQAAVLSATVSGVVFGVIEGVRRGWAQGVVAGVLFGLLFGMIATWRRRRTSWLISRYTSRAGIRYEDLSTLGTKIRDGKPPESVEEADALRRFVDYRRRAAARLPWPGLATTLPLVVLGGLGLVAGAIVPGALLLMLSFALAFAVLLTRRREPRRLDRMDALLAAYPGASPRSETDGSIGAGD